MAAGKGTRGRRTRLWGGAKSWIVRWGHAPPRSANTEEKTIETKERRRGKAEIARQLADQ